MTTSKLTPLVSLVGPQGSRRMKIVVVDDRRDGSSRRRRTIYDTPPLGQRIVFSREGESRPRGEGTGRVHKMKFK